MRENWWKFLVLAGVVGGLVWWRQGQAPKEEIEVQTPEERLEEQVNRFLDDSGISLPEGAERANLSDVSGGDASGVVSKEESGSLTELTVIADLPELTGGSYVAWLVSDEGVFMRLGALRAAKGGFLVDFSSTSDLTGYDTVVVSRETSITTQPSSEILRGSF